MSKRHRFRLRRRNNKASTLKYSRRTQRRLQTEKLERRELLAADFNPFHNYFDNHDVNEDLFVTPADALVVVNALNQQGPGSLRDANTAEAEPSRSRYYLDVDGDEYLSPADALAVINRLNSPEGQDANDVVAFRLELTDLAGNVITSTSPNENFYVNTYVQDVRGAQATGVFAAYLDVLYDTGLVSFNRRETQTIRFNDGTTSGTYKLTFDGQTTGDIDFTFSNLNRTGSDFANAAAIEAALEALPNIEGVDVTPTPRTNRSYEIRFGGDQANTDVSLLVESDVSLSGGSNPGLSISETSTIGSFFGSLTFGVPVYDDALSGSEGSGVIDEVGAVAQEQLAGDEFLLFRSEFRATAEGTAVFSGDPADVTPDHDVLVHIDSPPPIPDDRIHYGAASLSIVAHLNAVDDNFTGSDALAEDSDAVSLDVLDNDSLVAGSTGTLALDPNGLGTPSNGGTVSIVDGEISYKPAANFFGTETFTYTAVDGLGHSDTATVTIEVTAVNDAPVAVDNSFTGANAVQEDAQDVRLDVLGNDNPGPGEASVDSVTITSVGTPSQNGSVAIIENGAALQYTPAANFFGTETFTYTIIDSGGLTATATVTVEVNGVNDDPIVADDQFTGNRAVLEDSTTNLLDVLVNDNPGPGEASVDALTIVSVGATSNGGSVTRVNNNTALNYAPVGNFFGTETFTYTVRDNAGKEATATVTVQVNNVNDAPTAVDDNPVVDEMTSGNVLDVTSNDSAGINEDQVDSVTIISVGTPNMGGEVTVDTSNNRLIYKPDAGKFGPFTESFTYTIEDDAGLQSTATVQVDVVPVVRPRARNDVFDATEDSSNNELQVLQNDLGNDGFPLRITRIVSGPANGTATINGNVITYTPAADFFGQETLVYEIDDDFVGSEGPSQPSQATVTIDVSGLNDAPVNTVPAAQSVAEDDTLVFSAANSNRISISDVDAAQANVEVRLSVGQGTLTLGSTSNVSISNGANGTAAMTLTGKVSDINAAIAGMSYKPQADFAGSDQLTIRTNDKGNTGAGGELIVTSNIAITVNPVNDAPELSVPVSQGEKVLVIKNINKEFSTAEGNPITVSDVDVGSGQLQVTLSVARGTFSLSGTSGLTFSQGDGSADASMTFTGTTSAINAALNGLVYSPETDFTGDVQFSLNVNDQGNTGAGGTLTDSADIVLEVLDFIPSEFSGFAYVDPNNDGIKGAQERALGGITVTLEGTDFQGKPVKLTDVTKNDGSYSFPFVAPGNYTIWAEQAQHMVDGKETATQVVNRDGDPIQNVQISDNDKFSVQIPIEGGVFGRQLNFAERGLGPRFVTLSDIFASKPKEGIIFDTHLTAGMQWWASLDGWDSIRSANLTLAQDLKSAQLTVIDGSGVQRQTTINTHDYSKFRFGGNDGQGGHVVRIVGSFADFFAQNEQPEGEAGSTSRYEAVEEQLAARLHAEGHADFAHAADAVFADESWA